MGYATVADVMHALDAIAPPHLKIEDDPIGLHVGDPTQPVARLLVALDVTRAVAEAARKKGAAMIVAHHPLVYHPLRAVRSDDPIGAVVLDCARANIAVAPRTPTGTWRAAASTTCWPACSASARRARCASPTASGSSRSPCSCRTATAMPC
jgi:hypothetical protein